MTDIKKQLADQTLRELNAPERPKAQSRVWTDPKDYQYLGVWPTRSYLSASSTIRTRLKERTSVGRQNAQKRNTCPPIMLHEPCMNNTEKVSGKFRRVEEGWKRPTTSAYLEFLGFAQASLEEVLGDIRDAKTDGFLKSKPGSNLSDIGIDLRVLKGPSQVKGEPTEPGHPYCQPLSTLNGNTLTYEIFVELINKTDWLLRKLVESLERKLSDDQKNYQIEKARIKSNLDVNL